MIIGVVGFIGSGKGTVGEILVKEYGFIAESFAKPLKDAISIIFNWPRNLLEGDTKESREWREQVDEWWSKQLGWSVTPRAVLQKMGTEAGRNVFGAPLWTSSLIARLDPVKNYVITDVRFANEIDTIRNAFGEIIRVKRGPEPRWINQAIHMLKVNPDQSSFLYEEGQNSKEIHISEYGWVNSKMDRTIQNDGTIEDLTDKVKTYMKTMEGLF